MLEQLGWDWLSPLQASAIFGVVVGGLFGILAQRTRFCLRRGLVGPRKSERNQTLATWLAALGVAILGTQTAVLLGWIEFSEHRFHGASIPWLGIAVGGLLFGAGMVLTRGCASRLTVLAGSGNLRALFVLIVFAITAHATLKGVLAPLRTALSEFTLTSNVNALLTQSTVATVATTLLLFLAIALFVNRHRPSGAHLTASALIGLLVPIAWVGTGWVLQDDFDPIVFQSLSFTSSSSEWLFWSVASTSIGAGFGVGLFTGVLSGSALSAMTSGEFRWISFESPAQTGRYLAGAVLMGTGGVLAGGCSVGAGLSGLSTLSVSAALALSSIVTGVKATNALMQYDGSVTTTSVPVTH